MLSEYTIIAWRRCNEIAPALAFCGLWQDFFVGFYDYRGVHTRFNVRVGVGPALRIVQALELCNHQRTGKAGLTWVFTVNGREGARD